MAVFKRTTSKGETEFFHYKFFKAGKEYYGVCEGCTTKKKARAYEEAEREKVEDGVKYGRKVKRARKIAERVKESVMAGTGGKKIPLADSIEAAMEMPREHKTGLEYAKQKKSHWRDFVSFIKSKHPLVKHISDVESTHAKEYIGYIRKNGRFDKTVKNGGVIGDYTRDYNLSAASTNLMLTTLKETFKLLMDDAGLDENPFQKIKKTDSESVSREVFTEDEIKKIFKEADKFLYPLFRIGLATAMREADCCLLKWSDVDFDNNIIRRKTRKTGQKIEVPMVLGLYEYMLDLKEKSNGSEYVLPAQADLYLNDRTALCMRIKNFLKGLGITTTAKVEGRDRLVSVKDFHSLRHTFCYIAGLHRIPLVIVQAIVGHMSEEMTKHYQQHANFEDKRNALEQMPDFMQGIATPPLLPAGNTKKDRIMKLLEGATEKQLDEIITILEK